MSTNRHSVMETSGPSGGEFARRVVILLFGMVQALILVRIVFVLLNASESNALVAGIMNVSQVFVGPFAGILHASALQAGGSVLDVAAVVAFIGWTFLEFLVVAGLGIFRRDRA